MTAATKPTPNTKHSSAGRLPSMRAPFVARVVDSRTVTNRFAGNGREQQQQQQQQVAQFATTRARQITCPVRDLFEVLPARCHESPRFARD